MKIGIFDPYLNTLGGGEKYMLYLALCLSKKHDVFLFWDPKKQQEIKKIAQDRFGFNLESINFVENIFSKETLFAKRLWEEQKYDIIIYLSDGSIPVSFKKNIIIHFQFPVEWVKKTLWTKLKLLQIKSIICNSYFTKSYIDKKFNVQSAVVYPPVSLPNNVHIKKENVILHVGRFGLSREGANFKKQDFMINAFKKIREEVNGWRFVLIISVKEEDKDALQDLQKKALDAHAEIIINPSNDRLWEMYKKARIYWHASGYGEDINKYPERAEHFGIATAESMGAGAVPVVINAGGQPEIVRDGENGYLWNTEEELIKKTKQLISDSKLWKQLSDEGKKSVAKFSKERFFDEVKRIVEL